MSDSLQTFHEQFLETLLSIDRVAARNMIYSATDAPDPIENLVVPTLEKLGERWESGDLALSQVYMGARICEEILDDLLAAGRPGSDGSVAQARTESPRIGIAVYRDLHGLGKKIICSMLKSSDIPFADYGVGIETVPLIQKAVADRIDILLVSVLMLPSALAVQELIAGLRQAGSSAKVVVGGAPFRLDPTLAEEVDADAYGRTASDALRIISELQRVTA